MALSSLLILAFLEIRVELILIAWQTRADPVRGRACKAAAEMGSFQQWAGERLTVALSPHEPAVHREPLRRISEHGSRRDWSGRAVKPN